MSRRRLSTWLWMRDNIGYYSQQSYMDNQALIDTVMPRNGGLLQADGTWYVHPNEIGSDFALALPGLAEQNNQLYMPAVVATTPDVVTVLDNPVLQQTAVDNLEILATTRFDSPWDGMYYNLESIPLNRQDELNAFLQLLANMTHSLGWSVGISLKGRTGDTGPDQSTAYAYDYAVVAGLAEYVDMRCYNHYRPLPRSIAPYWWVDGCTSYAFDQGMTRRQLGVGLGTFSRWWPDSGADAAIPVSYHGAWELMSTNSSRMDWIEENDNGVVRERYMLLGAGHAWVADSNTMRDRIDLLVSDHDLFNVNLWLLGMEHGGIWPVLTSWKYAIREPPDVFFGGWGDED